MKLDDFLFLLKNTGQINIVGGKKKEIRNVGGIFRWVLIGARKCSITKKFAM